MRRSINVVSGFVFLIIAACGAAAPPDAIVPEVTGRLEDAAIYEASGLARSQREVGVLWVINDNGSKNIVHSIDLTGSRLGEFELKKSRNKDWEDLASFRRGDVPYLMVADIGDNDAKRDHRTLYIVEEPPAEKKAKARLDWQVDFYYPDGPRDSESAAVDVDKQRALILSKRDLPPQLYSVPLQANADEPVAATRLGSIETLQKPSRSEVEFAPRTNDWFWQPVGMDISDDNRAAVILTYRAVYYYERQAKQSWLDALNSKPMRVSIGTFENAEAVTFSDSKRTVFVTGENKHSRLLRIDFNEVAQQ